MPEAKAPLIEAADLLMDISHRLKYGKPITTAHSTFERLAIECRREAATADLPCIFCGRATDDARMMDDNGAIACRECGNAEIETQAREGHAYAVAMCPQYQTRTRWEADARLIVAARDAFDFAVAYDAYMSDQFPEGPTSSALHPKASAIWTHCRAAVAKATGAA